MSMHRIVFFSVLVLGCVACSRPGPEVLATYRGGEITLTDLDRYVRSLPEGRRIAPTTGRDAWLRELIGRLAVERVLEASDEVREQLANPEAEARRRWASAALLATAVTGQLARDTRPTEQAVAEQLAALGERQPVPLDTFRHLFLRLDRAATVAEKEAIGRLGSELARRLRAGEDFAELARQHSQSGDAADGGRVVNQHPALLEAKAQRALAALEEGAVSELVETRTGLHIFKLERRITPKGGTGDAQRLARSRATRQALAEARVELLAELRQRFEVSTSESPWQVGSFAVTESDLSYITVQGQTDESRREAIIEHLLLAEEGRRRGLDTPALAARVGEALRREAIQAVYLERRTELVAAVPAERLRATYDARPSAFATPETAELEMIFVPQGRDSFATQRRMEDHVAELRAGADFAALARRVSSGPEAATGGDLGALVPRQWARLGPEIYKAVTALDPGAISDPIYCTDRLLSNDPQTLRGGFAIVRVRRKHAPTERSFEQALDAVRATWAQRNARQLDEELVAAVLEEAKFDIVRLPQPEALLE